MALLTYDDIQSERNIDLTDPNGQDVATSLINAAIAWVERTIGYALESAETVQYFDGGHHALWLSTGAPVSAVALATKINGSYVVIATEGYDWSDKGEIYAFYALPEGFKAVKATYTAGWTAETLPRDLRDALIDWVALKLQAVSNFSSSTTTTGDDDEESGSSTIGTGQLKRMTAGDYTEEYATAEGDAYWKAKAAQLARSIGDDVAPAIQEVVARYQRPLAL